MGVSDRDWTKYKVIYFDANNKLHVEQTDKFRAQEKEKAKLLMQQQAQLSQK